MCVCVFAIACSPHPPLCPPAVHSPLLKFSGWATPTFIKIASDPCPRLHPPCVYRGTLCVCVCECVWVCLPLPAPSTLHCVLPLFIPRQINLVGGPRLHVSRLRPILARGSIHLVHHEGNCVCVCVFVIACSGALRHGFA